uniref:Uncharacterized protein n=1 Tax=Romanomermis culicivorax TaxID=13658 RepID=A0A915K5A8_ROMCU
MLFHLVEQKTKAEKSYFGNFYNPAAWTQTFTKWSEIDVWCRSFDDSDAIRRSKLRLLPKKLFESSLAIEFLYKGIGTPWYIIIMFMPASMNKALPSNYVLNFHNSIVVRPPSLLLIVYLFGCNKLSISYVWRRVPCVWDPDNWVKDNWVNDHWGNLFYVIGPRGYQFRK